MSTTLAPPPQRPLTPESPVTGPRGDEPGAAGGPGRPSEPRRRWVVPALVALLSVTAGAYLWNLSASGDANSFYAAAVQAGTKSWKAFFFGSLDSSNFITVDKPPASLWVMELSGRLFGFNSWSMLVPQALEGVAAVALLYAAVRRWFGAPAGLLAGAVLASPRSPRSCSASTTPTRCWCCCSSAAAYSLTRALEKAGTRWIVATGALLGFAFLAKMLQAFTVVPAFAVVYLLAAPTALRRRLWQLAGGGAAMVLAAGWWVATVALWPAGSRPMIDGSPDNSIFNLIFGYNGLERVRRRRRRPVAAGAATSAAATGLLRLFNDLMGGQASWLLPAALVALVVGLCGERRAPRTDRTRAALLLWGGWLVVTGRSSASARASSTPTTPSRWPRRSPRWSASAAACLAAPRQAASPACSAPPRSPSPRSGRTYCSGGRPPGSRGSRVVVLGAGSVAAVALLAVAAPRRRQRLPPSARSSACPASPPSAARRPTPPDCHDRPHRHDPLGRARRARPRRSGRRRPGRRSGGGTRRPVPQAGSRRGARAAAPPARRPPGGLPTALSGQLGRRPRRPRGGRRGSGGAGPRRRGRSAAGGPAAPRERRPRQGAASPTPAPTAGSPRPSARRAPPPTSSPPAVTR